MAGDAPDAGRPLPRAVEVAALRAELIDAGYRPIEVMNHDTDHRDAGKAPVRRTWQLGPPIERTDPGALNTGILCEGFRAIDIDIDDPAIAGQVRALVVEMFGETAMRHRGNSPRGLLLYRAAEGAPTKRAIVGTAGKVEVLGRGQQFVAFGYHPTGAELLWHPESPRTVAADALPAVTEDQVAALLAAVAPLIGANHAEDKKRTRPDVDPTLAADPFKVLAAVAAIPNEGPADWEKWNRIGMAIWVATRGGESGRAAFHAWSERHPSYDKDATNARWDHYASSPPTRIGAGTLFYLAQEAQRRAGNGDAEEPDCFGDYPEGPAEGDAGVERDTDGTTGRPDPTAEWWIGRKLDRPEPLLGEVITNTTRAMIGGETGIGKSHLAMGIAAALATGTPFANWRAYRPARVLYVDGEMARDLVQERIVDLKRRLGGADLDNLFVVCREDYADFEPLNTEAGQAAIRALVQRWKIEVVIFDNRMSLLSGDMKEEQPWTDTMPLVRFLTRNRVAQIWIDHTGHDKTKIYGSSTKEWQLDVVILLTKADRHDADVAFKMGFTKARRRRPETRADFATVTLMLRADEWHVDGATDTPRAGKVSPKGREFWVAFLDALRNSTTPGRVPRDAWFAECVRAGLFTEPPHGVDERERVKRLSQFRKYVSELRTAELIDVDGEIVIDLRRKPT